MVDQKSKMKPKQQVFQFKSRRLCLQTMMVGLCVLSLSISSVQTAACPASVPYSTAITTEQYKFLTYITTEAYAIAAGPVSNSIYYLYRLYSSYYTTVRKVDASGSQTWLATFSFFPNAKSLSVDATEQNVYVASRITTLEVLRLAASTGSIITQHQL